MNEFKSSYPENSFGYFVDMLEWTKTTNKIPEDQKHDHLKIIEDLIELHCAKGEIRYKRKYS